MDEINSGYVNAQGAQTKTATQLENDLVPKRDVDLIDRVRRLELINNVHHVKLEAERRVGVAIEVCKLPVLPDDNEACRKAAIRVLTEFLSSGA